MGADLVDMPIWLAVLNYYCCYYYIIQFKIYNSCTLVKYWSSILDKKNSGTLHIPQQIFNIIPSPNQHPYPWTRKRLQLFYFSSFLVFSLLLLLLGFSPLLLLLPEHLPSHTFWRPRSRPQVIWDTNVQKIGTDRGSIKSDNYERNNKIDHISKSKPWFHVWGSYGQDILYNNP